MPDILTHVLLAYVLMELLAWRIKWLTPQYIVVGMLGTLLLDIHKMYLLIPGTTIESVLGIPFSWLPLRNSWAVLILAVIGSLMLTANERKRVFSLLLAGALSHKLLDALNRIPGPDPTRPTEPFTYVDLPGIWVSDDLWPMMLAMGLAAVAFVASHQSWIRKTLAFDQRQEGG